MSSGYSHPVAVSWGILPAAQPLLTSCPTLTEGLRTVTVSFDRPAVLPQPPRALGKECMGWECGTTYLLLYVTSNRSGLKAQGPGSGLTADLLISSIKGLILSSWHFHKLRGSKKGPQGSPGSAQSRKNRFPGATAPQASSSRPGTSPSPERRPFLGRTAWAHPVSGVTHQLCLLVPPPLCPGYLQPDLMAERISGNLQEGFKHGKIA